jgi:hypothetical protein
MDLHKNSRDITAFITLGRLVRQYTLLIGATNAPATFLYIVTKILAYYYPYNCAPFVDNVYISGAKQLDQNNTIIGIPGVWKHVLKHI